MNFIEQFGGYDVVKEKYQDLSDSDVITIGPLEVPAKPYFEEELLEYRRQHNIFEVMDKIVVPDSEDRTEVYEIHEFQNFNNILMCVDPDRHGFLFSVPRTSAKHATDAEIKALARGAD